MLKARKQKSIKFRETPKGARTAAKRSGMKRRDDVANVQDLIDEALDPSFDPELDAELDLLYEDELADAYYTFLFGNPADDWDDWSDDV
jgi:hypothetical protein